mmetsp:Transcript_10696/g.25246  ORF Transcript_10696/g.25246 Transcript_10696/m.25246 type:complete len:372 (+) Transcript_10696:36-1151(+)|eukprot:CAMPEP_0181473278 /NCGR_PEP_ID=MMETSP1110-20121109/40039_1 /TAXON_ID=174948 /ORGANISM="Symbiodinium sp., Strain CCMP421" /LENGTH=371 /DNA_ID=CAMNT_0023598385 /DNA_START=38 /DNA_END=1153 /DNA_ORIENTATION=-
MSKVISRQPRMSRRRTEGDNSYHAANAAPRQGAIALSMRKASMPRLSLRDVGMASLAPLSPVITPKTPVEAMSVARKVQMLRRSTLPALMDVNTEALMLSRELRLDFSEVRNVVQELRAEDRRLANGGMAEDVFRSCLERLFGVLADRKVQEAYAEAYVAEGPINMRRFMAWYRANIFALSKTAKGPDSDYLTLELAKKYHCSCLDLDKVKLKFDQFDLDKSGFIDEQEFESMIYQLLGCTGKTDLPSSRLQRFWNEADKDKDGVIDFEEFTEWYMKYFAQAAKDGPIEAFYASYMPDVQRQHTLESKAVSKDRLLVPRKRLSKGSTSASPISSPSVSALTPVSNLSPRSDFGDFAGDLDALTIWSRNVTQ